VKTMRLQIVSSSAILGLFCSLVLFYFSSPLSANAMPPSVDSPEDQVFQFMQSGSHTWTDGQSTNATAYLWIPVHCQKLHGLIVMGTNVPEQKLATDHEFRSMAERNSLGIVWTSPTVMYFRSKNENEDVVQFLQELLNGLASNSGYPEVATVPWIPIGESGHLLFVDALVDAAPQRCIAGIWLKNPHLPPHDRNVPALVIFGTAQEWSQDKTDIRTHWRDVSFYEHALDERKAHPEWPLSLVIDGGSGHFDLSQRLISYVENYIDQITRMRLPQISSSLQTVFVQKTGFLANLPLPNHEQALIQSTDLSSLKERSLPWFPDRKSAEDALKIATINWMAKSQIPGFLSSNGQPVPFDFNGISSISPEMEADGISFSLRSQALDKIPSNFVGAGESLANSNQTPEIEWLSGAVRPLGNDRFQISLDRSFPQQAIYLDARLRGTDEIRASVQPLAIKLQHNREGMAQIIEFALLKDILYTQHEVQLVAHSDSGLPVSFYVVAGPAYVEDHRLILTSIPPNTRFPVSVTVAAWQWGRNIEPKVKEAAIVKQSFLISKQ